MTPNEIKVALEEMPNITTKYLGPVYDEWLGTCHEFEVRHSNFENYCFIAVNENNLQGAKTSINLYFQE